MATFFRENNNGFLTFDNVLEEQFERPATVTKFPIQRSARTADHRQQEQMQLTVQGLITETPWAAFLQEQFEIDDALGTFIFTGNDLGDFDENLGKRSRASVEFWRRAEPELLSYFSNRLGFVEDLFVTNISYGVTKAHHLIYTIDCVQVEFSESQTVALPPLAVRRAAPQVCPKVDVGSRATDEVRPTDARDITISKGLLELATGTRGGDSAVQTLNDTLNQLTGAN